MDTQEKILQIIRGEKKAPLISAFLAFLSFAYRTGISARNWAYDRGFLPSTKLSVPVISIGNIVAGGTGKTPLVHLLANQLQDKARLAILTRGYRSQIEKSGRSERIHSQTSPETCGDEPYFLAKKTKAAVWVGVDRSASGRLAIEGGPIAFSSTTGCSIAALNEILRSSSSMARTPFLVAGFCRGDSSATRPSDLSLPTSSSLPTSKMKNTIGNSKNKYLPSQARPRSAPSWKFWLPPCLAKSVSFADRKARPLPAGRA